MRTVVNFKHKSCVRNRANQSNVEGTETWDRCMDGWVESEKLFLLKAIARLKSKTNTFGL
jgi:hypothetical protein